MSTVLSALGAETLADLIVHNAQTRGDELAFQGVGPVTHRQHLRRVEQLSAGLDRTGITRGDRVAVLSKNRIEFIELIGAAAHLGAIVSAINWRLSATEVALVLDNDAPKLVFAEDEFWPLLEPALECLGSDLDFVSLGNRHGGFRCADDLYMPEAPCPAVSACADDPVLLVHTAWTDGRPKAAMLSHRNLIANAAQLQSAWGLTPADVHLCCLPLFHITAISLTLATQLAGGCSVLMPKYGAEEASALIQKHQVTLLAEFAPMLEGLLSACDDPATQLRSIRHVCGLDTAKTIQRLESLCTGATFWSGYGQTEVCGLASMGRFSDAPGAVGFPLPLCSIDIVDDEGLSLPMGDVGEIVVRGPSVFAGYRGRPAETARTLRDGCLHTGDSGRFDAQGRLWYVGRLAVKELIKTGGENVYPSEVEAVLRQHPALREVAVIGVPDPSWGEAIKAVCTVADGAAPTEQELIDFVAERIARYKRPRFVIFVPALPKQADGSTDRERIRQLYG